MHELINSQFYNVGDMNQIFHEHKYCRITEDRCPNCGARLLFGQKYLYTAKQIWCWNCFWFWEA